MNQKKITLKDIAEAAHVSSGTVSLVLNGKGDTARISLQRQEEIRALAREMGYDRPITRIKNRKPVFCFFFPSDNISFLNGSLSFIADYTDADQPFELVFQFFTVNELYRKEDRFTSSVYDGIILCGLSDTDVDFIEGYDFDIPVIIFNRSSSKYTCVISDSLDTGIRIAELFHQHGHKRAAYLYAVNRAKSSSMKRAGFNDTFQQLTDTQPLNIAFAPDNCYACTKEIFESPSYPTAVFCDSVYLLPILNAIRDCNLNVPEDVEIITDGDVEEYSHIPNIGITCVNISIANMIQDCLLLLQNQMENRNYPPVKREYPSEFIYRESFPEHRS